MTTTLKCRHCEYSVDLNKETTSHNAHTLIYDPITGKKRKGKKFGWAALRNHYQTKHPAEYREIRQWIDATTAHKLVRSLDQEELLGGHLKKEAVRLPGDDKEDELHEDGYADEDQPGRHWAYDHASDMNDYEFPDEDG